MVRYDRFAGFERGREREREREREDIEACPSSGTITSGHSRRAVQTGRRDLLASARDIAPM
jgi:hypothetical protein